jgi:hypothetical protein
VVDDFVLIDATQEEIVQEFVKESTKRIEANVARVIAQLETGGKPYHQFAQTFEECVQEITERHGSDAESLQMLGIAKT